MDEGPFPILKSAPIVEAVIHWLAEPGKDLDQEEVRRELRARLPEYPKCKPQHGIEIAASGSRDGTSQVVHRTQWNGFRLTRSDEPFVVQFTPSGVVFSRLKPYKTWDNLQSEGLRLWNLFVEMAQPVLIKRLGVRFINRIALCSDEPASKYLEGSSSLFKEFASKTFFYKDTFQIPETQYQVNWIRTLQLSPDTSERGLIVDIDTGISDIPATDATIVTKRLNKMRAIKNQVFFGCMTKEALERFNKS